jgi:deazaflavin-dependent oxidoreductase (nitroreductase family)
VAEERKISRIERLGRSVGNTRPGVYLMRYVFTPLDKLTYRLTGGKRGLSPPAMTAALLTTTGRKSGRKVTTPVLVLPDRGSFIVVGSNYGRGRHPAWTYNLLADGTASVRMRERDQDMVARRLSEDEAQAYWPRLIEMWPGWQTYMKITDREFRMFRLEPLEDQRPGSTARPS